MIEIYVTLLIYIFHSPLYSTKPKGMELVLWVEPEKLVKAHENNEVCKT